MVKPDPNAKVETDDGSDIFSAESEDDDPVRLSEFPLSSFRYDLRSMRLWMPISFGLVSLYDLTGVLGLLDPLKL